MWSLATIRNRSGHFRWLPWLKSRRWIHEEAQLVHNLWASFADPGFEAHDFWFLNVQARGYVERGNCSPIYQMQVSRLRDLFALVPVDLRFELNWAGP
jgi:hypothetical protein